MLDIRLEDVQEHNMQFEMERAWGAALFWEDRGEGRLAAQELDKAVEMEEALVKFRRAKIDRLIDNW